MLKQIHLSHFRNYADQLVQFHPQAVYILGDNAQGKTNLLEAIYYLGRGASFRTSSRDDLIQNGADMAQIRAATEHDGLADEIEVRLSSSERSFWRNGKKSRRPDQHWPHVILFAPEETLLFKLSPGERRNYFDTLIGGLEASYAKLVRDYGKVVTQRNRLFKDADMYAPMQLQHMLEPWNQQLMQLGSQIMERRQAWTAFLQEQLQRIHPHFCAQDGDISLIYEPNVPEIDQFAQQVAQRSQDERIRRMSLVGPHRDEYRIELGGQDLRHQGSQGQHRGVILSLKIAEIFKTTQVLGRSPLLLLDDVASELDPKRCSAFFQFVQPLQCQTIVTTTHAAGTIPELSKDFVMLRVVDGAVHLS